MSATETMSPAAFREQLSGIYGPEMVAAILDGPNKFTSGHKSFRAEIAKYRLAESSDSSVGVQLKFPLLRSIFSTCVSTENSRRSEQDPHLKLAPKVTQLVTPLRPTPKGLPPSQTMSTCFKATAIAAFVLCLAGAIFARVYSK